MSNFEEQKNLQLGIDRLKNLIVDFRKELPNILSPLNQIRMHLDKIFEIEEEHSLMLEIDESEILENAVDSLIEHSGYWDEMLELLDELISKIEDWEDEDENVIDLVAEYLNYLDEIKEKLSLANVDFLEYDNYLDGVDDMLAEVFNSLEEFVV